MTFDLLTDETYFLNDAQAQQPPVQYVCAIMQHGIEYNIINIANQLSFIYQSIAPELRVFVLSLTKSIKAANFIRIFKKK